MSIEDFLTSNRNGVNKSYEDPVSLFTYSLQLPIQTVTDLEAISKLIFELLEQLFQNDFRKQFLNALHDFNNKNCINLCPNNTNVTYRVNVRDAFRFKIVFFVSLKYRKSLFQQSPDSINFFQNLLHEILESICITKPFSLYLLKLIEMILKKREDVLTPNLSIVVLKIMTKVAYSPLTGFKHCAQNVSRIVLRSLPRVTKNYLCNFNNLPIKGIDLNDVLKLCNEKQIQVFLNLINNQILKLFCNNTDSRDGSFYYEAVINIHTFEAFTEKVWPFYCPYFQEFDEGEFYQSLLKYWIPMTIKKYKNEFYLFILNKNVDFFLKACTLLETKKKGFYDKERFDVETFKFLKYPKTSAIGLRIVTTYVKKHTSPDRIEIEMVQFFLNNFSDSEFSDYNLKSLKQFFSQIFLVGHLSLSKSTEVNTDLFTKFLTFVFKFCLSRVNNTQSCEIAAQLLKIVWDIAAGSSCDLITLYRIDRENVYENGNNFYFQKLIQTGFWNETFLSSSFIKQIEFFFRDKLNFCPKLINVIIVRYLQYIDIDDLPNLEQLVDHMSQSVCLQSSEKTRSYTDLIVSFKKLKNKSYEHEITNLSGIFKRKIDCCDLQDLFSCVLILDVCITIAKQDDLDILFLLDKSLIFFENIFNDNLNYDLNVKESKVMEAFLNNVIEYLLISKTQWPKFNSAKLLNQLCMIIEKSNMKRPVSLASNVVHCFGSFMEECEKDREVKIQLLDRTLRSLYRNKQRGRIRRNPETRLVIHALCLTDKNLSKPFLVSSLNFMLEVLTNPLSSDSTLSSTLHSLEVLVSDNSIHQFTLPFVVEIIENCVRLFNKSSWIVRNADLQLLKSLIERFLGVYLDENLRPKTVEDLFVLFPSLIPYFYRILSKQELEDSAMIVLLFFSESQINTNSYFGESLRDVFHQFKHIFVYIIKNYSNNLGFLAIKAFTALCPGKHIPEVFSEIVDYIKRDFVQIPKNVFVNLIKLLQELYHKFEKLLVKTRRDIVTFAINDLVNFLKPYDCFYFNLLFLKLYTVEEITCKVLHLLEFENVDYQKRIWLNNYLPDVIAHSDFSQLEFVLSKILEFQIPEFLQIKILSILVDRSSNEGFPLNQVIEILISKLTTLSDRAKFLTSAYSKTILLFHEITEDLNLSEVLIAEIRQDFETDCIYKVYIYVLALAHCNCDIDEGFIHNSIQKYIDSIDNDEEVLADMSVTIKFLYKCSSSSDRYKVVKLAFYLLLKECAFFEICRFVSWLTNTHCSSPLVSLVNLVKISNLTKFVGEKRLAIKLLSEFYYYVNSLPDDLEESDTYYLIESNCPLSKHYLKVIIIKTLIECSVTLGR